MKKLIIALSLFFCASAFAQTVVGSSFGFSTSSTNKCDDPIKGKTIICATPSVVTVSFDGAAPVTLPAKGNDGVAATINIGTVSAGAAGTAPKVTNTGTANAALFNFTIPAGVNGADGKAATVSVGSVSSGTAASVTNSGTAQAAVLNFVLQKGDKGDPGAATLTNANCGLIFTGQTNADGSIGVKISCN